MPCQVEETRWEKEQRAIQERHRKEIAKLAKAVNRAEVMLCGACRVLSDDYGYDFGKNPELDEWWDKHKKKDDKRRIKEQKEATAAAREEWVQEQARLLMSKPLDQMDGDEKSILREAGVIG